MNTDKQLFKILLRDNQIAIRERDDLVLSDILKFIITYSEKEVILYHDGIITLTESGREYIFKHRKAIFLKKSNKYWELIPEEYFGKKVEINHVFKLSLKGVRHTSH
jgi:hypothetical protein